MGAWSLTHGSCWQGLRGPDLFDTGSMCRRRSGHRRRGWASGQENGLCSQNHSRREGLPPAYCTVSRTRLTYGGGVC